MDVLTRALQLKQAPVDKESSDASSTAEPQPSVTT